VLDPRPRQARLLHCAVIATYGALFVPLLMGAMDGNTGLYGVKVAALFSVTLAINFLVLWKRQIIYRFVSRLYGTPVRFFELPYFALVAFLDIVLFVVVPFLLGLVKLSGGLAGLPQDDIATRYILFAGGAGFVTAAVSGFDIYPVNRFGTKAALEHLVSITRDLMRFSNRMLLLVTGAVIFGWVFKKVEFTLAEIYITSYGVIGFALGSTAVLGARITELLYMLSSVEETEGSQGGAADGPPRYPDNPRHKR